MILSEGREIKPRHKARPRPSIGETPGGRDAQGEPAPRRLRSRTDVAHNRPVHVVWELTLACNLRCRHCGSRAGPPRPGELTTAECLDVVRQLAELGTREITLIGGEAYLRRDWLEIVRGIADRGIHCGLQTGGRALTEDKIRRAVEAGLSALGVSVDGPRDLHDRLRGVPGSYDQALAVLRATARHGIAPSVNTQINALSRPYLREIFDTILANGARAWQVQLTVAMGNAVDNDAMLLQPHDIPEVLEDLAALFHEGRRKGLRLLPGNSIGYFGPHEAAWRSLTGDPAPWQPCTAGETSLGLEADGKIKSCPSLPSDSYLGGMAREVTIAEAVAALQGRVARRDRRGAGFCGSCYYWPVCRGGCTWVSHVLTGSRGNNPYCHYRARELASRGIRERIVKIAEAPGLPFDYGRFAIVAEDREGRVVAPAAARDTKRRPRGARKLMLCDGCGEYIFAAEKACPHCERATAPRRAPDHEIEGVMRSLIEGVARHSRAIEDILARP